MSVFCRVLEVFVGVLLLCLHVRIAKRRQQAQSVKRIKGNVVTPDILFYY